MEILKDPNKTKILKCLENKYPNVCFYANSEESKNELYFLVYKTSKSKATGYFIDTVFPENEGQLIHGLKEKVRIIAKIRNLPRCNRFIRVLVNTHKYNKKILFNINYDFFDFLSLYIEQKDIKQTFIQKEILRHATIDINRKA